VWRFAHLIEQFSGLLTPPLIGYAYPTRLPDSSCLAHDTMRCAHTPQGGTHLLVAQNYALSHSYMQAGGQDVGE
jgi:hypothetical protein